MWGLRRPSFDGCCAVPDRQQGAQRAPGAHTFGVQLLSQRARHVRPLVLTVIAIAPTFRCAAYAAACQPAQLSHRPPCPGPAGLLGCTGGGERRPVR